MSRLKEIKPEDVSDKTKEIFKKMVFIPNIFSIMANSEPVMASFASHHDNLGNFSLSAKYRKVISLAVSEFNNCPYCIALHTSGAINNGLLSEQECLDARRMVSPYSKVDSLLKFTKSILENKGHVSHEIINTVKTEGFTDRDIVEIISIISVIIQANYTANVSKPEIDFPIPPVLDE